MASSGLGGAMGIIGAGLGAVTNLAKGIFGAVQTSRANKQIKNLLNNPVTYKRPEEYFQELQQRKQMAAQQQLPGQGYIENNIGQAVASAMTGAERGAISSNTYQKSVGDILQKQINAYQDLGFQASQFQQQQKENYLGTLQRGAGYSDWEFNVNKLQPYEQKLNMAFSNRQAGMQNLFGGAEGVIGGINDFAGTRYYSDVLKALQGGNNTQGAIGGGNRSLPIGQPYSPQNNLNNNLSSLMGNVNINWPK